MFKSAFTFEANYFVLMPNRLPFLTFAIAVLLMNLPQYPYLVERQWSILLSCGEVPRRIG